MKRLLLPLVIALCGLLSMATPADAHPMGNFSINHFTSIRVQSGNVRLLYVIDMAEIPTFQELANLGSSHSTDLPPAERARYLSRKARELSAGLQLDMNGRPLKLQVQAGDLLFPPGAGGLPTERIYLVLGASLPANHGTLRFQDLNFPGRAGWKEIVAAGGRGMQLRAASVGATSRSHALTIYPSTIVSSPPQNLSATLTVAPGAAAAPAWTAPAAVIRQAERPLLSRNGGWSLLARGLTKTGPNQTQQRGFAASRNDPLTGLIGQRRLPLGLLLLSLVVAFWFGAGHALSPGHGKTIVAAYLVGNQGTWKQAAILGLTVTATHTAGVFALGLVTLYLSSFILPDQLYPWLGFISGLMVAGMGLTLCARRLRALRRPATARTHQQHGSMNSPTSGYRFGQRHARLAGLPLPAAAPTEPALHRHGPFGRAHSHAPIAESTTSSGVRLRSLLALGVSGGLLPCPSALVVLLSAIAFHRLLFGMILIVAFSFGLAGTLTGVGLVAVYGRRLMGRLGQAKSRPALPLLAAVRVLPVISALVVATLGSAIALGALSPGMLPSGLGGL